MRLYIQQYVDHSEPSRPQKFFGVFNKHVVEIARFKFKSHAIEYVKSKTKPHAGREE